MKTEAERVKEYLSEMVDRHHRGQLPEHVRLRKELLFAILDASSEVIGDVIKNIPDAKIFARDDLRSFLAAVVADVILKAGKSVLMRKGN